MLSNKLFIDKLLAILLMLLIAFSANAQKTKKEEVAVKFGLKYSSVFTSDLLSSNAITIPIEGVTFAYSPNYSSAFGAVLRFGSNSRFSFQTGINTIRRAYTVNIDADSQTFNNKIRVSSFQVPFECLIQVPISKQIKMGVGFGVNLDFFPSDLALRSDSFYVGTLRNYWTVPSLRGSFAIDYETEKSGTFVLGASYQRMLTYMNWFSLEYSATKQTIYAIRKLQGHYFSIDLSYFFNQQQTRNKKR